MREILFKAKHINTDKWVYGNYAFCDCYTKQKHYIFQNKPLEYAVDENTICQYTGLTDKYGNKIFENSIVKISYDEDYSEIGYVKYSSAGVRYVLVIYGQTYRFDETCDIEVLGNRFDNPELLGGMEC